MPELPEVEVTRRGIAPHIEGGRIDAITVRNGALRWPVPEVVRKHLAGAMVRSVGRRGKFILIECDSASVRGTLMIHLGMTGTLRILERGAAPGRHDHVDIVIGDTLMRYHDPRRFGALLWHDSRDGPAEANPHLANLGVEPFSSHFAGESGGDLLYRATRGRAVAVKQMLLSGRIVVGVGNIYASESLFRARINPKLPAGRIGRERYRLLAQAIRDTLAAAIDKGGSTLRDFIASDGSTGYFQLEYFVYDRAGLPCRICATPVRVLRQGQRSTFYCPNCQRH